MYEDATETDIERIVSQYSPSLLRLAMTRLPSVADAEDAVQEVFLRLVSKRPRFRDEGHERAWLIRATLQRTSDICRAAERQCLPLEAGGEDIPATEQAPSELLSAIQSLPEKYSAVIHLYYYEGYSIKEIAKLLGLPAPTVGTRLARGRERLKVMLKEGLE